ncbi:VapE domain-containing protein [Staphylococcus sp. Mo2-6]|uniref:VapE domain-containing protein n=1 Tax=Staphylococcus sp. Mo2-6 TaxID=3135641 RepID=UPI003D05D6D8
MHELDNITPLEQLQYNGKMTYAQATSRLSSYWRNTEKSWSELLQKLSVTTRTQETIAEYNTMKKAEQSEIKDVGGFVGGYLKEGKRRKGYVMNRSMLTLDIDFADENMDEIIEMFFGYAYAVYSTHKHRATTPRLRFVVPLKRHVNGDEYEAVARKVAESIGIDYFDDTTYQPHRLMYWPSTSADAEYLFTYQDAPFIDPDDVLAEYKDWKDPLEWPYSERETASYKRLADKQGDPHNKPGIVGAFCRAYDIHDVIEHYLSDVYEQYDDTRYTYVGGSTAGGLVIYENGKFAYSHHGTDPAGGELCNSFDLLRVHKFGIQDEETPEDTPINRLPSYISMQKLAQNDGEVKINMMMETYEAEDDFSDYIDKAERDERREHYKWATQLDVDKQGNVLATTPNIGLILRHDDKLKGKIAYDEFNNRLSVLGSTPWRKEDTVSYWRDADDAGLRIYLEQEHGIYNRSKTDDAVNEIATENKFHPVRDYLDGLEWDGVERLDTLFIDYLGVEDTELNRAVTRKAFTAGVARIYQPGIKFDYMTTLYGGQGQYKSTVLRKMGGAWFSESLTSVTGKEAYEALQGTWLIEMAELAATKKAEVEAIKHFISKQVDSFRVAYGRHAEDFPRQCVFFGTTNKIDFLRDETGGRRFWALAVDKRNASKNINELDDPALTKQLWAEAKQRYNDGEKLYLPSHLEDKMGERQAVHTEESVYQGIVEEFIDTPVPYTQDYSWRDLDLDTKRAYIQSGNPDVLPQEPAGYEYRDRICVSEVWCECLGKDKGNFPRMIQTELKSVLKSLKGWEPYTGNNRGRLKFGIGYGAQKAFSRVENE